VRAGVISVLTVNYQSGEDLRGLIESLRSHATGTDVEVIVTNNSPSEALDFAREERSFPVSIVDSPNVGFGAGINRAFRESRGEIIFIANPDVRINDETFPQARAYLEEHSDVGILLPLLRYPEGDVQLSIRRFYTWPVVMYARSPLRGIGPPPEFFRRYLYEGASRTQPRDVDWGLGAAMFLRRMDVVEAGEIFDERFFLYFEDVDLCYRMWRRGKRVVYCPRIECIHDHRRSSARPISKAGWRHFQSLLKFVAKHRGLPGRPR